MQKVARREPNGESKGGPIKKQNIIKKLTKN